jgi:hypothetical protein
MKLPIWLDAQNDLQDALLALPSQFPRPTTLVSPRTEVELEAWRQVEALRRAKLDAAIRLWLTDRIWPADLDATDGWLLGLRICAAKDWLGLGRVGVVFAAHQTTLLMQLLIEGWVKCFLEKYLSELEYRRAGYLCGRDDAGGFSE